MMCFGVYFDQILSIFKYIQFMIVTAHLLCGGGGGGVVVAIFISK